MIFALRNSGVLYLNGICDCPFKSNGYRWEIVCVLNKLELSPSVQSFTFEFNRKGLAVSYLEEEVQVMFSNLFWEIVHREVHLFPRCKSSFTWFNCENFLFEDVLLESLFCAWLTGVSPSLHLYLAIIRHFESPVRADTANVFECQSYFPWL